MKTGNDGEDRIIDDRENRFFLQRDDRAELVYRINGHRLVLIHTEVPEELRDRGIAGRLVQAAVVRAADEGLTVVPLCPYASQWLQDHPDEGATVTIDWAAARS